MKTPIDIRSLRTGDIAYFYHLHIDTANNTNRPADEENTWIFDVSGKARPMLVLSDQFRSSRGRTWSLMVKLTSQQHRGSIPIGNCLPDGVTSYIDDSLPLRLPDNLLAQRGIPSRIPQQDFANILKIVQHKALAGWGVSLRE